jgi:DNA-binding response OmpR family regulator
VLSWRILFADNDPFFLKVRAEFLEKAGFEVLRAHSVEEAERILRDELIHLAIFDIRLTDDNDEKDISGLVLAKTKAYRAVPKIMLTGFPTYQQVREALGPSLDSTTPAIDFLAKDEGPEAMIGAVEKALAERVRINRNLVIITDDRKPITFIHLVDLIEPELEHDHKILLARAEELEALFRRLFYNDEQIIINHLLWQSPRSVALTVFKFTQGEPPKSLIVVCGQRKQIIEEEHRYRMFAPAPGLTSTVLVESSETLHFAANAYALTDTDLENTSSLFEAYLTRPEKSFNACLNALFERTLSEWHQGKRIIEENRSLNEIYLDLLGLSGEFVSKKQFEKHIRFLIKQIPRLGVKIEIASEMMTFWFKGISFSYPDPTTFLNRTLDIEDTILLLTTPGTLSGDNVLTDASGQAWVTSFSDAGLAPLLWNYISLEAAIRFDWIDQSNLRWVHDMERYLVSGDFSKLHVEDIEAPLRKPVKAIQAIRALVSKTTGRNNLPYHLGLFFHAVSRIAQAKLTTRLKVLDNELAHLAHALIAAAMLYGHILQSTQNLSRDDKPQEIGIRIDKANRIVWIDGKEVGLSRISYDLLCSLYDHPDQLRTRRELIEQVFGLKYDEMDRSQMSRLNTAINRLRKAIRDDADNPRYLFTHPGGGYILALDPRT